MSPDEVDAALAARGLRWRRDGQALVKEHRAGGFPAAVDYSNRVASVAETAGHHPDILIQWRTVTLRLWTHSAGGITQRDLEVAEEIDALTGPGKPAGPV